MGFRQGIGGLFIRDARQDQLHIHSTLGSEFQSRLHLIIQNEVGRHDMYIVFGPVENVHIDALPHLIIVQWTIAVGHHIALRLHRRRGQQRLVPAGFLLRQVPHLQEHQGKALHRLSPQEDGGILPVAEALLAVDVLIRQIYAAGEGHLAVDDQDFPVIPVVIVGGEEGLDGGKGLAADAQLLQPPGIVPR